jgi:hypothetical protein
VVSGVRAGRGGEESGQEPVEAMTCLMRV